MAEMCREANCFLGEDVLAAFAKGLAEEISPVGREVFKQLLE
ncbi:MAG: fumarate hydratase, partial [Bacillota bacterium]